MTRPEIPEPNEENINACWNEWKDDEKNIAQEKVLHFLFKEQCPENAEIKDILLKVTVLNDFYKVNVDRHSDLYTVSEHIEGCKKIDEKLCSGDLDLVNEIARVTVDEKTGKTINFYSFASKYCSHHKPETYPIYDRYVDEMLWYFQNNGDGFFSSLGFKRGELRTYERFFEIIQAFKRCYDPHEKFTLRQIDIYLWSVGRDYFSKKH